MIQDYSKDLEVVARLAANPEDLPELLGRALDSLRELIPYDLATIFDLDGDQLRVRIARGPLADQQVRDHQLELTRFPTMRRALELRRPIALTEEEHSSEEGDPFDGVLDLPHGHSCMVVPLFADHENLGIMTFDRTACETYDEERVALAGVYGHIISLAFQVANQSEALARYRDQLKEETRLLHGFDESGCWQCRSLKSMPSSVIQRVVTRAKQVAPTDAPVLIGGETGTGKEVLAAALHSWSQRAEAPFVALNCGAIPENLIESELFGHVEGAFTGATSPRKGRFLTANGGTLFLDEIGELPMVAQTRLLRVLQEGTFEAVGSDESVKVDVRVIAATNRDLEEEVAAGRFREDLLYRINLFPIEMPPLREHLEDLPQLVESLGTQLMVRIKETEKESFFEKLSSHDWPGNIRELRNALERAKIMSGGQELTPQHLQVSTSHASTTASTAKDTGFDTWDLREVESLHISRALEHTGGKIYGDDGAAALLGLKPTTLQSRIKKLGVTKP